MGGTEQYELTLVVNGSPHFRGSSEQQHPNRSEGEARSNGASILPRSDHLLLGVSSFEKSLPCYRMAYGTTAERPRDANGRVWFQLARKTRIALAQASLSEAPGIAHVAPFDPGAFEAGLRDRRVTIQPSSDRVRREA